MSTLVLRYSAFAAAAIAVNLGTQWLSLALYRGIHALLVAVAVGTATGLVTKYVLDKHWIFRDDTRGIGDTGSQFVRYTFTGVVTTALFWGTEAGFHLALDTDWASYAGALLGLTAGYVVKYRLDRTFVFQGTA